MTIIERSPLRTTAINPVATAASARPPNTDSTSAMSHGCAPRFAGSPVARMTPTAMPSATCTATKKRLGRTRHVVRYTFEFRHEGALCYEGDQSAVWINTVADRDDAAALGPGPSMDAGALE